ncbi:MAG: arylsulfatase [Prolixibacteraceae bacterium]
MKSISTIGILLVFTAFFACKSSNQNKSDKLNVILILADDQGYGDIGFNGNPYLQTPTLDSLSNVSYRFDNFYVSPVCAPTRASLLTGKYHYRTGTYWVSNGKENMNPAEYTLAELFRDNGYATGIFGKWHNGAHYPFHPNQQGFQKFVGFCMGHWNNYFNTTLEENGEPVLAEGYITDYLTKRAIQFIDENKSHPFFCYIPYNTPHSPFQVPDKYFDKYKQMGLDDKAACVYGMCENIDDNVKKVLDEIDQLGLKEKTIVLYLSDNGPVPGRYNANLRGTKGHIHEGGVKVPSMMYVPKSLMNGFQKQGHIQQIAAHIDIMPTLIDLLQLKVDSVPDFDGLSLVKVMEGLSDSLVNNRIFYSKAPQQFPEYMGGAVRTGNYRMVYRENDTMLFDLSTDPYEQYNLKNELPQLTDSLLNNYLHWIKKTMDKMPSFTAIPIGVPEQTNITMPAHEAKITGNVHFKEGHGWANDWVLGFQNSLDSIYWETTVENGTKYRLIMDYVASEKLLGKSVIISTESNSLNKIIDKVSDGVYVPSPDRFPRKEIGERRWGHLELGEFYMQHSDRYVSLKLNTTEINDLEFKALRLIKADEN